MHLDFLRVQHVPVVLFHPGHAFKDHDHRAPLSAHVNRLKRSIQNEDARIHSKGDITRASQKVSKNGVRSGERRHPCLRFTGILAGAFETERGQDAREPPTGCRRS
jgi:hypothetical protein